jgi:hypothetical protein
LDEATATRTRTCPRCGGRFTPSPGRGRPRIYCSLCTPRKPEDRRAAQEHWDQVAFESHRRHAEILRGYHEDWKARIASGEQGSGVW